jgi:hypothetical protein
VTLPWQDIAEQVGLGEVEVALSVYFVDPLPGNSTTLMAPVVLLTVSSYGDVVSLPSLSKQNLTIFLPAFFSENPQSLTIAVRPACFPTRWPQLQA